MFAELAPPPLPHIGLDRQKCSHLESNQGPSDICNLYNQMLYQLSYSQLGISSRVCLLSWRARTRASHRRVETARARH